MPRNNIDEDGLSFYRLDFITPDILAKANTYPKGVFYASVKVRDMIGMGMSIVPSPDELPGHVVVPELCYSRSRAAETKNEVADLMIFLKLHANKQPLWGPSPALAT